MVGGGGQVAGYTPAGDAGGGYAGAQAEPMMGLNRTHSQVTNSSTVQLKDPLPPPHNVSDSYLGVTRANIVWLPGMLLALDHWPLATWLNLWADLFGILLAWIGHLSSKTRLSKTANINQWDHL